MWRPPRPSTVSSSSTSAGSTGSAVDDSVSRAHAAFLEWRGVPAPARGALVKRLGELLAVHKDDLATLISLEVGKITSEARGEVQEMIDICDFAVGLSRQLYGRTMPSERPGHRLMETWHPLGVVGVISAFNFPAAVWSWNTAVALVCGDPVIWKPSELAPLTALASHAILDQAIAECGAPADLNQVVIGGADVGQALVDHPGVALLSATGSTRMGRAVGPRVAERFGRSLLELGGNNAAIVEPDRGSRPHHARVWCSPRPGRPVSAARPCAVSSRTAASSTSSPTAWSLPTAGCRSATRWRTAPWSDPSSTALPTRAWRRPSSRLRTEGGKLVAGGGRELEEAAPNAFYAKPAIVRIDKQTDVVEQETFAPLLYVLPYEDFEEAIALNNAVPQGLSSSVFTSDQAEAEKFLSAEGSDCGIVNVNIGTSGAEIGGAFGGEKETGGGRESGSDAWRAYMRRATNTVNYSGELPLAQGVNFTV